ncbi:restriction system-associated AAA family ATPase [uncultured Microscilla sp.]|uniref:restriction system-associated AAA family ATPase n=1 Tax=uncultured Microscilla sp. TaxID=432653 RepID=UPI0026202C20|nr:restriction system-associated AAA family ATPase [uncultured Microscilla sp.]
MKLLSLHINSNYGNIKKGFKLQFRPFFEKQVIEQQEILEFHPFCFAGLNGSGKSNVLEVLANIFYHIECCANVNQPQNFQEIFHPEICKPNAFELEYYICLDRDLNYKVENLVKVKITKKEKTQKDDGFPKLTYQPFPFEEEPIPVSVVAEKYAEIPAPAKRFLPDLIIGYSSGENEILSIPFFKNRLLHYDEYRIALEKQARYTEPESSLLYIDYEMSQAVLLVNLIFQSNEVLTPLTEELGILGMTRFRMNLNLHTHNNRHILDEYHNVIEAFKRCATTFYEEDHRLTLDFWFDPNGNMKKAFHKNFPGGIFQLFQSFQILYTLNHHSIKDYIKSDVYQSRGFYTEGKVPLPEPEDKIFYFLDYFINKKHKNSTEETSLLMKNLSDGEQQFLHTLGICLMLKNKSALLLLDEPETHFNPSWRSKFISILKNSLNYSQSNHLMREILITSHSPFIISDCLPNNVVLFDKDETGSTTATKVTDLENSFNTYGTSVELILERLFNYDQSIGDLANSELEGINFEKIKTKADINEIKTKLKKLGESIEKDMILARLNRINLEN